MSTFERTERKRRTKVLHELRSSFYVLPEDAQVCEISTAGVATIREYYWWPRMCKVMYIDTTGGDWEYVSSPHGLYPVFK